MNHYKMYIILFMSFLIYAEKCQASHLVSKYEEVVVALIDESSN